MAGGTELGFGLAAEFGFAEAVLDGCEVVPAGPASGGTAAVVGAIEGGVTGGAAETVLDFAAPSLWLENHQ